MSLNPKDEKIKSEKYMRSGSKYICRKCKAKYFSKEETEKCFDEHKETENKEDKK